MSTTSVTSGVPLVRLADHPGGIRVVTRDNPTAAVPFGLAAQMAAAVEAADADAERSPHFKNSCAHDRH